MIHGRLTTTRREIIAQGRRRMSLRARLLTGLVAVIAVFLIVMGTVSIIVLGTLERDQFNANLRLAGRQSVAELVKSTDGYSAVYLSLDPGTVGELTADSPATAEMRALLEGMADQTGPRILRHLTGTTVQVWVPVRSPASYAERNHASGPSSPRLAGEWQASGQAAAAPEPAASPRA